MTKSEIFKQAWELAKQGASQFGGSSKEYFAEALIMTYRKVPFKLEAKRIAAINKLEIALKATPEAKNRKIVAYINAMKTNTEWKIKKINELLNMVNTKNAA